MNEHNENHMTCTPKKKKVVLQTILVRKPEQPTEKK